MTVFALVPLFGPVLGPIVGGFAAESIGWRWLMGIIAILSGLAAILITVTLPETYCPVLLRRMAVQFSTATGKAYISSVQLEPVRVIQRMLGAHAIESSVSVAGPLLWLDLRLVHEVSTAISNCSDAAVEACMYQ